MAVIDSFAFGYLIVKVLGYQVIRMLVMMEVVRMIPSALLWFVQVLYCFLRLLVDMRRLQMMLFVECLSCIESCVSL